MPLVTLTSLLEGKTPAERRLIKAEALERLQNAGEFRVGSRYVRFSRLTTWTTNGVTVTVTGVRRAGQVFWVACTASDANGPLPAPDNNEHAFVNPPIRRWTRPPIYNDDGTIADPGETVEQIAAVIQQMIYESVILWARQHGWNG